MSNGFKRGCANRNEALFFAFATNTNQLLTHLDVVDEESAQFADSQAARVNGFENCDITQKSRGIDCWRFLISSVGIYRSLMRFEILQWRIEQIDHLLLGEKFRQPLFEFWQLNAANRALCEIASLNQKFIEGTQRAESKMNRRTTQIIATEVAQEIPKLIALQ